MHANILKYDYLSVQWFSETHFNREMKIEQTKTLILKLWVHLYRREFRQKAEGSIVVSAALQGYMQHAAKAKAVAVQQQKSLACWPG